MKKIISLFVAVLLVVSIVPVSGIIKAEAVSSVPCTVSAGDIIEFGMYPQDEVNLTDNANLLDLVEEWKSLGLYGGNGHYETNCYRAHENGSMKPVDYIMFADVIYDGIKYRILKITGNTPSSTGNIWTPCDTRYRAFKFKPIKWEVKEVGTSGITLECVKSIDSRPFNQYIYYDYHADKYYNESGEEFSPTSFSSSTLYSWLNDDFYDTAFSESDKNEIIGKVTITSLLLSASKKEKLKKDKTTYADALGHGGEWTTDGIWWTSVAFKNGSGTSETIVVTNGNTDARYASTLGIGVVPMITVRPDHIYEETNRKEPTCTEKGHIEYTCSVCGGTKTETIPAKGHIYSRKTVEPTCTELGYTEYTCKCGYSFRDMYIEADGHSYEAEFVPPDGDNEGYIEYTCSRCSDKYTTGLDEHSFSERKIEPTCEEQGYTEHYCDCGCGYSYRTDYIDMLGHNYETNEVVEPTDASEGYTEYKCSVCGDTYIDSIVAPLGHHYITEVEKEPTCKEEGLLRYRCTTCESNYCVHIPVTDHKLTHVKNDASCTEAGSEYDICEFCGVKFNEETIKATGHNYTSVITKEATCTEKGVLTYTCSCGDTYTEDIPMVEHSLTHVKENPTCTKDGTEYDICSECGNKFNEETIKATGHSYTSVITKEATCTEKGVLTYTCSCGDTYTEDIPTVEHTLTHVTEDPTCTKDGAEYDICSECGNKFNEETIKATGHSYTSVVTKEATCTEKGVITYTCSCGDTYTEDIPMVEHSLTHVKEDPTCTKDGAEYDICSECGNKFNEETIKATGHSYTSVITKEATCTEKGVLTYTCSCGDTYTEDIPLAEHRLIHYVEKATCTENGKSYDICSECGGTFNEAVIKATDHTYENGICVSCGKVESWNYTLNNGTVTITGYTGHEKVLDVPAEIGGYPVTAIADSAYAYNEELEYVSIPNSVFIIGKGAFRGCSNLKEICISDSVSTICEGAFADCTSLAIVYIASINTILKGAFSNNDSRLSFIVQKDTVTASNAAAEGFICNTYMYPKEKDGKGAIAVSGAVTLYEDLDYYYWGKLIEKYPYAFYLYFDELTFDGVLESDVVAIDEGNIDSSAEYLTMKEVYISINIDGKSIAFKDLMEMIESGSVDSAITFEDSQGVKKNFFQKIGDFFENLLNAISKAINAIVRVFKKK